MEPGQEYYLKTDVIGICSRKQFACKGDKVKVISLHHNMAIVEMGASKFSTTIDNLAPGKIERDLPVLQPAKAPLTKSKRTTTYKSKSLF
jgi:hypothetical protein